MSVDCIAQNISLSRFGPTGDDGKKRNSHGFMPLRCEIPRLLFFPQLYIQCTSSISSPRHGIIISGGGGLCGYGYREHHCSRAPKMGRGQKHGWVVKEGGGQKEQAEALCDCPCHGREGWFPLPTPPFEI